MPDTARKTLDGKADKTEAMFSAHKKLTGLLITSYHYGKQGLVRARVCT